MARLRDLVRSTHGSRRRVIHERNKSVINSVDNSYLIDELGHRIYHDGRIDYMEDQVTVTHDIEVMSTYNNERLFRIMMEAKKLIDSRNEDNKKNKSHRPISFKLQPRHTS